jgi:glucan-binding YG repeat protein
MKKLIVSGLLSCSLLLSGFIGATKTEAAGTAAETATNIALDYVGVPYVYGGSSPNGFDCSGLVNYTYKQAGVTLPRTAAELYTKGQAVAKDSLKEGDLVFFATTNTSRVSHVGIYMENGQFVHAGTSGVAVDSLSTRYWTKTFVGSKRIVSTPENGWVLSSGTWYFYDQGVKKTSWLKSGKEWYFLGTNGAMVTGWAKWSGEWYFLDRSGAMKTDWVYTGGKWYYLYADGSMAKSTTISGYVVGPDGAWIN